MDMVMYMVTILLVAPAVLIQGILLLASAYLRWKSNASRISLLKSLPSTPENELVSQRRVIAGFFHPYCNAGGGGERVLWAAIACLQRGEPNVVCVVYTGDLDAPKSDIIDKVKSRFGIILDPATLAFVYLPSRRLVDGDYWKRLTLLGQSFGSLVLAWEALDRLVPDVFIDTMGYAFTFTFIRWLRIRPLSRPLSPDIKQTIMPIGAYVHYPTISSHMLRRVKNREAGVTNSSKVASSHWRTALKLSYYRAFAFAYSYSLAQADEVVANGTWTKNNLDYLLFRWRNSLVRSFWGKTKHLSPDGVKVLYPPCDTEALQKLPLDGRKRLILSVAQFRPEKHHSAQLQALRALLRSHPEYLASNPKSGEEPLTLVLLGSVRNGDDSNRVKALQSLAVELGIQENVQFVLNARYDELVKWLGRASVGISSMIDEHFGINVVEMMAAGLIPVAHASGGPLLDIVTPLPAVNITSETSSPSMSPSATSFPAAFPSSSPSSSSSPPPITTAPANGAISGLQQRRPTSPKSPLKITTALLSPSLPSRGENPLSPKTPAPSNPMVLLPSGFLYESDPISAYFSVALHSALSMDQEDKLAMRRRAREGAKRFSTEVFEYGFKIWWDSLKARV